MNTAFEFIKASPVFHIATVVGLKPESVPLAL